MFMNADFLAYLLQGVAVALLFGAGYLVARRRFLWLLAAQHSLHERCEDAAFCAGLERGRKEHPGLREDTVAWFNRGYLEGVRAARKREMREQSAAQRGAVSPVCSPVVLGKRSAR